MQVASYDGFTVGDEVGIEDQMTQSQSSEGQGIEGQQSPEGPTSGDTSNAANGVEPHFIKSFGVAQRSIVLRSGLRKSHGVGTMLFQVTAANPSGIDAKITAAPAPAALLTKSDADADAATSRLPTDVALGRKPSHAGAIATGVIVSIAVAVVALTFYRKYRGNEMTQMLSSLRSQSTSGSSRTLYPGYSHYIIPLPTGSDGGSAGTKCRSTAKIPSATSVGGDSTIDAPRSTPESNVRAASNPIYAHGVSSSISSSDVGGGGGMNGRRIINNHNNDHHQYHHIHQFYTDSARRGIYSEGHESSATNLYAEVDGNDVEDLEPVAVPVPPTIAHAPNPKVFVEKTEGFTKQASVYGGFGGDDDSLSDVAVYDDFYVAGSAALHTEPAEGDLSSPQDEEATMLHTTSVYGTVECVGGANAINADVRTAGEGGEAHARTSSTSSSSSSLEPVSLAAQPGDIFAGSSMPNALVLDGLLEETDRLAGRLLLLANNGAVDRSC